MITTHLFLFWGFGVNLPDETYNAQDLLGLQNADRYVLNGGQLNGGGHLLIPSAIVVVIYPSFFLPGTWLLTVANAGPSNVDVVLSGYGLGFVPAGTLRRWTQRVDFTAANRDSFGQVEFIAAGNATITQVALELQDALDLALGGQS